MPAPSRQHKAPAFILPTSLLSDGFRLRPERDADIPFLMALYASTREAELAPVPWSDAQKAEFLAGQFKAQRHHYRTYFAETAFDIIERDGVPIGRLYVLAGETHVHVIDIALMPEARGRGTGTLLMNALQDYAGSMAMGLDLFVEKFNPARRLYQRLGFTEIAEHDVQVEMEWLPAKAAQLNTA